MIAAYAIGAEAVYLYIRGEYWKWINIMNDAIKECYDKGYIGKNIMGSKYSCEMYLYKGAGAYICGEESAMMNSLEGKRGYPRIKPPFPAQFGLWGCPTTINNIETLSCVPEIIKNGAEWFAGIGAPKHPGTLLYGVSGHVNKPGVYELPSGTPLMTIINDYAGGVLDGKKIKMVIPGGSSMPPLTPKECEDIDMDNESLKAIGSAIGTGGIIVMNEDTDLVEVLTRITHFYYHESCGQCTPCREGCGWMLRVLERIEAGMGRKSDLDLLVSVAKNIEGNTICALGEAAAWPVKFTINKFYDEFAAKIVPDEKDLPTMNKVHGLKHSSQYEVLRNDKEQEIVEEMIGKVRENVKEKRSTI